WRSLRFVDGAKGFEFLGRLRRVAALVQAIEPIRGKASRERMLLPTGLRQDAQDRRRCTVSRDTQLVHVVGAAAAVERRYPHYVSPASLKTVYEFRVGRE